MMRKVVRFYFRMRYFPREIFRILNEINDRICVIHDLYLEYSSIEKTEINELPEETTSFYTDVTRALLELHQTTRETAARVDAIARTVRKTDVAIACGMADRASAPQQGAAPPSPLAPMTENPVLVPPDTEHADLVRLEELLMKVLIALERSSGPVGPL